MNDTIHTVRVITSHAIDPATEKLTITALDAPGAGGASHLYWIEGFDSDNNNAMSDPPRDPWSTAHLLFQNGPIPEVGVNGITDEALLAIVADRLRGFQSGALACEEYAAALTNIETAMGWLKHRTRDRQSQSQSQRIQGADAA